MKSSVPQGFRLAAVHCGIKSRADRKDLTLIVTDGPAVAAGVYTRNLIFAAPVAIDRARTPSGKIRGIIANSGNANACTGERGLADAHEMTRLAAEAVSAAPEEFLVLSTGIIGEFLPMPKIAEGVKTAAAKLASDDASLLDAAQGIMTTDKFHKLVHRSVEIAGKTYRLAGMAKGAGMIGPRMATLLGVLLIDAPLTPADAQQVLSHVVEDSFNCISVEGHMSTNDTLLLLASGAAGGEPLSGESLLVLRSELKEMAIELAKMIPDDGEGATHCIEIRVQNCKSRADAWRIARTIADSPLVKTAIAGADPNWGRIVSAVGYSGVSFDPNQLELKVNGTLLYKQAAPVAFDAHAVSESIKNNRETIVEIQMSLGTEGVTFWTSDMTYEYIRINADYHT
jgi:glutamate N-acetyltransferase / amino-acid N-acetyltransferase